MKMIQITVLLCCVIIALSSQFSEDRQQEFDMIQKYESIHPVFDATNLLLEFDAFNEHWTIQLQVNEDISSVVAHIIDENGESVPYEQEAEHYECHYQGMILNAVSSFVALSFCPGAGVIGTLWLRGQTLFIKPINYYLDPLNEALTLADAHIIFRKDDYYDSDLSKHVWATTDWDAASFHSLDSIPKPIIPHLYNNPLNQSASNAAVSTRRRLGTNIIELYVLMDRSLYQKQGSSYSSTISLAKQVVNTASGMYQKTSWPSPVGSIKFKLIHVEVNIYKSFCSSCRSKANWNAALNNHMKKVHSGMQYDYAFGFFYNSNNVGGGASYPGKMCTNWNYGVSLGTRDANRMARLLAHEAGHNQGLSHDTDIGCCPPQYKTTGRQYKGACCKGPSSLCVAWIMDPQTNGDAFSPCSKTEMKDIHSGRHKYKPNLNCLLSTRISYSENKGKDGEYGAFEDESSCSQKYADKMCFYDTNDEEFMLEIDEECVNGEKVYSFVYNETDHYLYAMASDDGWVIGGDMIDVEESFVCFAKNLYECLAGNWSKPVADGDILGFKVDQNAMIKRCDDDVDEDAVKGLRLDSNATAIISVLVVTVIIIGVAIAVFIHRNRDRNRGKYSFNEKIGEVIDEVSEDEEAIVEEGDLQEIEVELNSSTLQ